MKKLYLTIFLMVLTISVLVFPASAFSAPDDTVDLVGQDYNAGEDYCTSLSPVGASVPDGYRLAAVTIEPHSFSNGSTRVCYFYAPISFESITMYINSSGHCVISNSPNSTSFYYVMNRFDSQFNQYLVTGYSGSTAGRTTINKNFIAFSYLPCYDANGVVVRPFEPLVDMSVVGVSSGLGVHISQNPSSFGTDYDLYLFPSLLSVDGGTVNRVISSPTYVSELTASQVAGLQNSGFGSLLDELQENYNNYYSGGSWYNRGLPQIHFFAECQDTSISYRFDPDFYNLPYAKLGSSNRPSTVFLKREDFYGGSRVYAYDHLCLILVGHGETKDSLIRYDFTPALLNDSSIVVPSQIEDKDTYISGTVSDFQELADYLKYLVQTNDGNRTIDNNNFLAALNTMSWSNIVAGGVYRGLTDFLPSLSYSIDYTFGNLFSDYFIPSAEQMDELEDELDDEREEFNEKFAFIDDVKDEVSFIIQTIITAGDQTRYFEFNLSNYHGVGVVRMCLSDKIPSNVLTIVKNFITCFLTIAVIMHIFKTLPSTIGKMPSGGD